MRIYKIKITKYPEIVLEDRVHDWQEDDGNTVKIDYSTHHLKDPGLRKEWEASGIPREKEHYQFFMPSETKIYRSRSSARDKQKAVERWGGEAIILVAEVGEFVSTEELAERRKQDRALARIEKLRKEIDGIRHDAGLEVPF